MEPRINFTVKYLVGIDKWGETIQAISRLEACVRMVWTRTKTGYEVEVFFENASPKIYRLLNPDPEAIAKARQEIKDGKFIVLA